MRRQARLAEEFAAVIDGRPAPSGASDDALAPLLAVARQLQSLPLGPTPQFRDSLRARLVAVAAVSPTAPIVPLSPVERLREWSDTWRAQRGIAAVAAVTAAVVGVAGVSVAATRSLPGDPFYGVKRSAEGVQLALARDDVSKGERHLLQAEERLDEVARLVGVDIALRVSAAPGIPLALGGGVSERVTSALTDMDAATRDGTRLLTRAYERSNDTDPLRTLADFADRQRRHLAAVVPELPSAARDAAAASLALVAQVEMRADALLNNGICGDECQPKPGPTAVPTPQPVPQESPTEDDLGPTPCSCAPTDAPPAQPTRSPDPQPTGTGEPPSSSPTPSPTPSDSEDPLPLPVPLPEPIDDVVDDVVETVEDLLPTPLPILPQAPVHPPLPPVLPE